MIGIRPAGGQPLLNPPMDTRIRAGDQIIAISEDFNTVRLTGLRRPEIEDGAICEGEPMPDQPERTLIVGWNWRAPEIIGELEHYVAPALGDGGGRRDCPGGDHRTAASRSQPAAAGVRGLQHDRLACAGPAESRNVHHIIVLAYSDLLPAQKADARTLMTLLHLREIARKSGHGFSIVSEMLDERNRDLALVTQADDFIMSDKITSLLLTQVSENKELLDVFMDLFDEKGSEVYMKRSVGLRENWCAAQLPHGGRGGPAPGRGRVWLPDPGAGERRSKELRCDHQPGEIPARHLHRSGPDHRAFPAGVTAIVNQSVLIVCAGWHLCPGEARKIAGFDLLFKR